MQDFANKIANKIGSFLHGNNNNGWTRNLTNIAAKWFLIFIIFLLFVCKAGKSVWLWTTFPPVNYLNYQNYPHIIKFCVRLILINSSALQKSILATLMQENPNKSVFSLQIVVFSCVLLGLTWKLGTFKAKCLQIQSNFPKTRGNLGQNVQYFSQMATLFVAFPKYSGHCSQFITSLWGFFQKFGKFYSKYIQVYSHYGD